MSSAADREEIARLEARVAELETELKQRLAYSREAKSRVFEASMLPFNVAPRMAELLSDALYWLRRDDE